MKKLITILLIVLCFVSISCFTKKDSRNVKSENQLKKSQTVSKSDYKQFIPKNAKNLIIKNVNLDHDPEQEIVVAYYDGWSRTSVFDSTDNGWVKHDLFLEKPPMISKTTELGDIDKPDLFVIDDINNDGMNDIIINWGTGMHGSITYVYNFEDKVVNLLTAENYYQPLNSPFLKDLDQTEIKVILSYIGERDAVTGKIKGNINQHSWSNEKKQFSTKVVGSYEF